MNKKICGALLENAWQEKMLKIASSLEILVENLIAIAKNNSR